MTDIELTLRIRCQLRLLVAALPAWKDRAFERSRYAGTRRAAFEAEVGKSKCLSLLKTLDALETAMCEVTPDWSGGASLSDGVQRMEAALRQRVPGIPDRVMSELSTRYMHSYR